MKLAAILQEEAEFAIDADGEERLLPKNPKTRALILATIENNKLSKKFAQKHKNKPFQAPRKRAGEYIIVSPSLDPRYKWRVTRFDQKGAYGHTEYRSYEEAVMEAGREADLKKAEFS